jgi:hypothetical protein
MGAIVAVDFDGVLNTYTGWLGEYNLYDPRPGAKEFIEELFDLGYDVFIHTTRNPDRVYEWLRDHQFPSINRIQITQVKPPALCYVDDRAVCFNGDFHKSIEQIKTFKTHWEKQLHANDRLPL